VLLHDGSESAVSCLPGDAASPASSRVEAERDALMRIAAAAAAATSLDDVLELTAEAAHEAIGEGGLSVTRWDREADAMCILASAGVSDHTPEAIPKDKIFPLDQFPDAGRLFRTGAPQFVTVDDPDADPREVEVLKARGMESAIGVPIVVDGGNVWGGVWAASPAGAPSFRARDLRFLETIAGQLAAVVDRAERFANVSRLAFEDPLTGLANRRALEERLGRAASHYQAEGVALALIVCDVDNLKAINDERGHQAGDRALKRVAEALVAAGSPYPTAMVARLSGDEFAIVLEGYSVSVAREVAGTALKLLRQGRDVRVSLSCGAAPASAEVDTPSALLRAADTAQYAAKRRGGDQICTADTAVSTESAAPRGRVNRRSLGERMDRRSAELLRSLDGAYREASTIDRLEVVVAGFAETLNAAAWTISFAEHGSPAIRSVSTADDRDSRLRGIRVALEDDVYPLADYPLTQELVQAGTGSFQIDGNDRSADPAERKLLAELGFSSVLASAISDLDGVHLLELYSDGDSGDLLSASLRIELLARAAAGGSAGTTERMAQLRKRTHQLTVTATLGTRLASLTKHAEIVEAAVDVLYREFGFPVCAIDRLTLDDRLELVDGRGLAVQRLLEGQGWTQPAGLGLTGRALRDRDVVVAADVRLEPDHRSTAETPDSRSELCAPLWAGDELWGVIDLQDPRVSAFDDDDVRLVKMVADQVSAALRSASLFGQLEAAYLGTAEALVAALEAKDSYTASHSRSIGEKSNAVGRELGLDDAQLRTLRFGAAFHDIGKLAIEESILCKPGPLTADERLRIEQHTVIGDQILAPIEFLEEVRPLVRGGHERWDGAGSPDGLARADIPLGARTIFACDAYDAMITDRPYRAALADGQAAAELAANAGTQFDPAVVEALLSVLGESGLHKQPVAAS